MGQNAGDIYLIPNITFFPIHSLVGVYQPIIPAPINAPISIAAGDINGDAKDDFVIFVPTNDGTGSFYANIFYSQGVSTSLNPSGTAWSFPATPRSSRSATSTATAAST